MVSSMKRKSPEKKRVHAKTKKNKTSTDINISIPNDSDFSEASTSGSDSSKQLPSIPEEGRHDDSEGFCECSESSESDERQEDRNLFYSRGKETVEPPLQDLQSSRPREVSMDTRISDRIKQRRFKATEPDYCDFAEVSARPKVFEAPSAHQADNHYVQKVAKDPLELSSDDCVCTKKRASCPCKSRSHIKSTAVQTESVTKQKSCKCGSVTQSGISKDSSPPKEIPTKSPIKLKSVDTASTKPSSSETKVKHYDFPNRFFSEQLSTSQVERITADSIEVIPNLTTERERVKKMRERDREAQERGKKALEKERIRRDYEELMKKLPMLQKKEHISRIGSDRPEYHMSEDRLKERERERQNRLENVYSQAVPELRPKIVTLPKTKPVPPKSDQPFDIIDRDDPRALNLGKWDTDTRPKTMFTAEEVQEIIKAFTVQKPEDRKAKLKQLLTSLKLQKEQLINEIKALPRDDSIEALLGDLTSFSNDDNGNEKHKKSRHTLDKKRRMEESDTSNTSQEGITKKTTKSKRKKMKKPVQRVLVLQNTSTQTTPKATKERTSSTPSETELAKEVEGAKICKKAHVPCDCRTGQSSEEICKIFIKLGEEDKTPKVEILPKELDKVGPKTKDAATSPQEAKRSPKLSTEAKKKENIPPAPPPSLRRERSKEVKKSKPRSRQESWRDHLSKNSTSSTSYLSPPDYTKVQTTSEISYSIRKNQYLKDPNLVNYIKRLLSMSKKSVDDLGVSSSDVPTPSESVIEMESNKPLIAIQDALRLISSYTSKDFTTSATGTSVPPNTSAETSAEQPEAEKVTSDLLSQYADVTDSCTKRIANLAAMIEQLRQEKLRMMRSPPLAGNLNEIPLVSPNFSDDKDNTSTKYFDFPPAGPQSNSTASMDEEEINKRLMEIDMSLAEKLKKFREKDVVEGRQSPEEPDQQFLDRLQKLIRDDKRNKPEEENERPFVKFLVDIPKLPILEPQPEGGPSTTESVKKRPPPSKGLSTAKKFNGEISLIPHELSTIVEADSQLSTRVSPNASKSLKSPEKPAFTSSKIPEDTEPSSKSLTCTESTCTNICSSWSKSQESSDSSGDLKSIEAMLRSIGMDWAIPTLYKTQEALALSSSSSSGDLSTSKKKTSVRKSTSTSEISLKDFLRKQMMSKISSSSLNKSDASPASFVRDCSEISAIQIMSSTEKAKQRTSTPVISDKSSMDKSKDDKEQLFTGVSDISSVRNSSGEQFVAKRTFKSLAGEEISSATKSSSED